MNKRIRLEYCCRDIGYGVEEDTVTGHWSGKRDSWGKRTFVVEDCAPLYLFDDEIVSEEPLPPLPERRTGGAATRAAFEIALNKFAIIGLSPNVRALAVAMFTAGMAHAGAMIAPEPLENRHDV